MVETEARPISVSAGADSARAEFRIRIVKPAHVSGVLQAPDTRPLVSGAVVLIPRDGMTLHRSASEDVEIRPDGRFIFRNVPPGSYQLRARAATDPSQVLLFGSFAVQVEADRDVPELIVTMAAGAVVDGKVEWIGTGAKARRHAQPAAGAGAVRGRHQLRRRPDRRRRLRRHVSPQRE